MLESLSIENIAVIEKAEIVFEPGLNVLTGETGAGKSIIIDSLCAVLGERTSRDLIRTGADYSKVTAVFKNVSPDVIESVCDMGIDYNGDDLVVTRVINSDGRNTCRINGNPANVGMLKSLGNTLVNIHGQHDSQALLQPEKHILFIDSAADNSALLSDYRQCFSQLVRNKRELDSLYKNEDDKSQRLDFLNYQIAELEGASLRVGEKEELNKRKSLIHNARKIKKCFEQAYSLLSLDGNCACDLLNECFENLKSVSDTSQQADYLSKSAESISISVNELAAEIRNASDLFVVDESELSAIDERLDLIYRITHKYGGDEQSAINKLDEFISERDSIFVSEKEIQNLEDKLKSISDELVEKADLLSQSRRIAANEFENKVISELRFLDMPDVQFKVNITNAPYSSKGAENIEFLISANPGEEPKALSKIASGGELSRIMLAIKNVISAADDIGTLIFDEVDSGVSGRAAQKIALKLKEVSSGRQVICVTHLAQIASHADRHLKIEKSVSDGKTFTDVSALDFEQRKRELARIMGGLEITQLQLENAHEMLVSAGIYWD